MREHQRCVVVEVAHMAGVVGDAADQQHADEGAATVQQLIGQQPGKPQHGAGKQGTQRIGGGHAVGQQQFGGTQHPSRKRRVFGITPRQVLYPIELFVIVDRYFPMAPVGHQRPHRQVQDNEQKQQPGQPWRVGGELSRGHRHKARTSRETCVSACKAGHCPEAR